MTGVAPQACTPPSLTRQRADIPQHWSQDPDFLDAARNVGNLTLPRYVQPTVWAKSEDIAGLPVAELQLHQFLYQGWNSYWLRHFAHGREGYVCIAKNKGELVLVNEFLSLLRNKGIDIEAAAVHLASQNQGSLAKNVAMKGLALHLADTVSGLVPLSTDPASQDTIRDLQQKVADLTQQLQARVEDLAESSVPGSGSNAGQARNAAKAPSRPQRQSALVFPQARASAPVAAKAASVHSSQDSDARPEHRPAAPVPEVILRPPVEGSPWLGLNMPSKISDTEVSKWVSNLNLNAQKKDEALAWLAQLDAWADQQGDDLLPRLRRCGVIWGVPTALVNKINVKPLIKLLGVASYMER